jgi:hypothetical protein
MWRRKYSHYFINIKNSRKRRQQSYCTSSHKKKNYFQEKAHKIYNLNWMWLAEVVSVIFVFPVSTSMSKTNFVLESSELTACGKEDTCLSCRWGQKQLRNTFNISKYRFIPTFSFNQIAHGTCLYFIYIWIFHKCYDSIILFNHSHDFSNLTPCLTLSNCKHEIWTWFLKFYIFDSRKFFIITISVILKEKIKSFTKEYRPHGEQLWLIYLAIQKCR